MATHAANRLVRKMGKYDQVVEYCKPKVRPRWISCEAYRALPETMVVRELRYFTKLRGGRTRVVTLVTTLIDAQEGEVSPWTLPDSCQRQCHGAFDFRELPLENKQKR